MRKAITIALSISTFLLLPSSGLAGLKTDRNSANNQLVISVAEGGWGNASVADIEAVLYSTAKEMAIYFPNKHLDTIRVEHGERPITLYRRGPNGEFIVHLSVADRYWAQLAYQFSHELAHILARYKDTKEHEEPNQWFEESLCVTASLFTLRQMAVTWKTAAPYPNWKSYAPSLREYADNAMSKRGHLLPVNMTLAEWYRENEPNLKNEDVDLPEARNNQVVVASKLLPIFEQNPNLWESISYLNVRKTGRPYLKNYLNNWYVSAPDKHKSLIRDVSYMFRE